MPELRKDYILEQWAIIATERGKRPDEFRHSEQQQKIPNYQKTCFFCPGNEHMTPPEITRITKETGTVGKNGNGEDKAGWLIRVFPNKFPAVVAEGNPQIQTHNTFFTFASAYGYHEVVVETPEHDKQLADLSEEHIAKVFFVYQERITALNAKQHIPYVQVFKNYGAEAGTSIQHTHSQIIAYNVLPQRIQEKIHAIKNYNSCPYCAIIQTEKNSYRAVFETPEVVCFTPYASRFPFEIWLFSKRHVQGMDELSPEEMKSLAVLLKKILQKLQHLNASYNMVINYAPEGTNLHFHIEILPRLTTWAGFELGTGTTINPVTPEEAATFYRDSGT
ncbi:galactose-1-phosphate uridylyltransferase [Candidatus Woesearchaeota archaeon]|nr:galactose-1-phosphate uridylyltransferase [Candidatus Woesearchaeota archaeon]